MKIKPNGHLWAALKAAGMNQRQFAEKIGEHFTRVNLVVNGRLILTDEQQKKYAEALGCTVKQVFP